MSRERNNFRKATCCPTSTRPASSSRETAGRSVGRAGLEPATDGLRVRYKGAGQDPKTAADLREHCSMQRSDTPCFADMRGHSADTFSRHEALGSHS